MLQIVQEIEGGGDISSPYFEPKERRSFSFASSLSAARVGWVDILVRCLNFIGR